MRYTAFVSALLLYACAGSPHSPLSRAAATRDVRELARILDSGYKDPDDIQESLLTAARSGCAECIPILLKHGAQLEYRSGVNKWTPLQHAVHKNQLESVQALVRSGADPNTALGMAAGFGYTDIVSFLLERGADPVRTRALDAAMSGARDIDHWTWGYCQPATVRVLLAHNPDLKLPESYRSRCKDAATLPPPR